MSYAPTVWVDEDGTGNGTVVTAARMNKIEQALAMAVAVAASSMVPTLLASGDTFAVPANTQILWSADMDIQGTLDISGTLVEF